MSPQDQAVHTWCMVEDLTTSSKAAPQVELPGRLWEGKEAVPSSLAAVVASCPGAFDAAASAAVVDALVAAAGCLMTLTPACTCSLQLPLKPEHDT